MPARPSSACARSLKSETFYKTASPLAIALGRDVSGQPVVADLARMPHLLIAGTTGSGKSVCIAALTACLVMNNTPDDLRLVMIDPKMVELVRFNGLPHLYGKVETEPGAHPGGAALDGGGNGPPLQSAGSLPLPQSGYL